MSASAMAAFRKTWVLAWLCGGLAVSADPVRPTLAGDDAALQAPAPLISTPTSPLAGPTATAAMPPADAPMPSVTQPPGLPPGSVASPWSTCGGTGCCGPVGGNGPILSEFFIRTGVNFLISGDVLKQALQTGTVQSFGGRSLFFNPAGSRAWTVEIGIDYFYNNGGKPTFEYPIDVRSPPNLPDQQTTLFAVIREYHRAAVHIAGGSELYMYNPGYQAGRNCRVGWDVGGRYGYSRLNLNVFPEDLDSGIIEFDRRSDAYGNVFVSLHADAEYPVLDCKSFVFGVRAEWGYNFTDIVKLLDADTKEVNVMFNIGLKF